MQSESTYGSYLIERVVGAVRLDVALYEQMACDAAATGQAFRIVLLAGLSNGLALVPRLGGAGVLAGIGAGILGWFLWAAVIGFFGWLLARRRPNRSLLRVLGFANAPAMLLLLGAVPVVGALVRIIVVIWLVVATARAVEASFDASRRRSMVISLGGFAAYLVLGVVSGYLAAS